MDDESKPQLQIEKLTTLLNGYRNLFYTAEQSIILNDFALNVLDCNINASHAFNMKRDEMIKQKLYDIFFSSDESNKSLKKEFISTMMELKVKKRMVKDLSLKLNNGTIFNGEVIFKFLKFNGKDAFQMIFKN